MVGAVAAKNRTPRGRVRAIPAAQNWDSRVDAATDARTTLAWLLTCLFCLFGGAGNHDFDGDPLSLRPKRRPTLVLEDERASRVDGVSREDSFVGLACDRARLAALSVDEANDRSPRTRRAGRPGRAGRSLLALFALGAGELLLLFASRKRQERQQHGNHQHTNLHGRRAPSLSAGYGAQGVKIAFRCVKGSLRAPSWAQRQKPPPRPCRRRSAWRRRREIHSRTPYPSANPTVRAIVRSSIRVGTTTALEIIIESYLP